MPAFLFLKGILFRDGVEAEIAEFAGSVPNFGEGSVELGSGFRYEVEKELVDPGSAVNRATLDFHQIDAMTGKRLERREERTRFVRKAECDGHL